ncbi:MAG: 50S ribosomal protein L1 [Deltaproteobacteria bacterium]|nr:50S ribosomal protein L1 [Deltaproteobacteria bacterium]
MAKRRGKRYSESKSQIQSGKQYPLDEAIPLLLKTATAKFNESVDAAFLLGIDVRRSDQMVRGAVVLPHSIGKETRIVVFAKGDKEKEAVEAGADFVGCDDLVGKIQKGWLDFDNAIATPDVMSTVAKVGKILGPRGLMPNPKTGTVTFDVGKVVRELKSGRVEYRSDKGGVVHALIGRKHLTPPQLRENFLAIYDSLLRNKPVASKSIFFRKITISATMGPGVEIDPQSIEVSAL